MVALSCVEMKLRNNLWTLTADITYIEIDLDIINLQPAVERQNTLFPKMATPNLVSK